MAQAPRERLNHLLELAAQGPAGRAALLGELADLLLDWPADYALAMRAPFEALFEKTAREVDAQTRVDVARRLEGTTNCRSRFSTSSSSRHRADCARAS